jgi:transcriptional regulator with XRE-family HTH domain
MVSPGGSILSLSVHDNLVQALSLALRERRAQLNFSQSDLARKSGLHRSYIGDLERGSRNISVKNLSRLAQALETNSSTLLEMAEDRLAALGPFKPKKKVARLYVRRENPIALKPFLDV